MTFRGIYHQRMVYRLYIHGVHEGSNILGNYMDTLPVKYKSTLK